MTEILGQQAEKLAKELACTSLVVVVVGLSIMAIAYYDRLDYSAAVSGRVKSLPGNSFQLLLLKSASS